MKTQFHYKARAKKRNPIFGVKGRLDVRIKFLLFLLFLFIIAMAVVLKQH